MIKTDVRPMRVEELEYRIHAFEVHYGVPSSRMVEAFTRDGVVDETDDLSAWSTLYRTLLVVRDSER